jgi:hypothetical protein
MPHITSLSNSYFGGFQMDVEVAVTREKNDKDKGSKRGAARFFRPVQGS